MIVSHFVGLFELVIEQLGMINAKSAVLTSHPYHLLNHVEAVFGDFGTRILLTDNFSRPLKLVIGFVELCLWRHPAQLTVLFPLEMLVRNGVSLHESVVVFHDNLVLLVSVGLRLGC